MNPMLDKGKRILSYLLFLPQRVFCARPLAFLSSNKSSSASSLLRLPSSSSKSSISCKLEGLGVTASKLLIGMINRCSLVMPGPPFRNLLKFSRPGTLPDELLEQKEMIKRNDLWLSIRTVISRHELSTFPRYTSECYRELKYQ